MGGINIFKTIERSLSLKLSVVIFLTTILSVFTVVGALIYCGQDQLNSRNIQILENKEERVEQEVRSFLYRLRTLSLAAREIENLIQSTSLKKEGRKKDEKTHRKVYEELMKNFQELQLIQLLSREGSLRREYRKGESLKGQRGISLYPRKGERELFFLGEKKGGAVYAPFHLFSHPPSHPPSHSPSFLRLLIPVKESFLLLGIGFEDFLHSLRKLQGRDFSFILFDGQGRILFHPNSLKGPFSQSHLSYSIGDEFPDGDAKKWIRDLLKKKKKNTKGEKKEKGPQTHFRQREAFLSFRQIEEGPEASLNFVSLLFLDSLPRLERLLGMKAFALMGVIIFLFSLIAWPIIHYLLKGLQEMIKEAKRYTRGEHDVVMGIRSQDEIGILAQTFQSMMTQVNEQTQFLRKSERRIREARDQAEQALSSKSHLLEDLRYQKEELERVSKDKDDLLAIVSHDLKNPLAVIETSMDILIEEEGLPKEVFDLLRRSKNSAKMAHHLVTDLLDLARLEGGIKLDFESFKIDELIEGVRDNFYLDIKKKNITLLCQGEKGLELMGDYGRLVQVLSNILGNALKFSPPGGRIEISLGTYKTQRSFQGMERGVEIRISDSGPGISRDKLDTIFKKFQQARKGDRKIGTGLGLTIARNICELHQGTLGVESEEGRGSVFIVKIPRLIERIEEGMLLSQPFEELHNSLRDSKKKLDPKKKTVLVADDEEGIRELLSDTLSSFEFNCLLAKNGVEALFLIHKYSVDLVVSDIRMEEMDGIALLKTIRRDFSDLPVIFMSANIDEISDGVVSKLGVKKLFTKPFDMDELSSYISKLLIEPLPPSSPFQGHEQKAPPKILLVDDSSDMQLLFKLLLSKEGVELDMASDGQEAIKEFSMALEKKGYDIIFMDLNMPEMSGDKTLKKIREIEKKRGIDPSYVVLLSSTSLRDDDPLYKLGFNSFMQKPVSREKLKNEIKKVI